MTSNCFYGLMPSMNKTIYTFDDKRVVAIPCDEVFENENLWEFYFRSGWGGNNEPEKGLELSKNKEYLSSKVYGYSHSGKTISLSSFGCQWDSGLVGYAILSKEKIRELYEIKKITKEWIEIVFRVLSREIEEHNHILRGNVWLLNIYSGRKLDFENVYYIGELDEKSLTEFCKELT